MPYRDRLRLESDVVPAETGRAVNLNLSINGEVRTFEGPLSVTDLLEALGLPRTGVAVERNRQIVPRTEHEVTRLENGDELEIVTLVGGG